MTAVMPCPMCGTEPLESARFCHSCGSPVAQSDSHAEYKQVTVLFADVVGSMHIAAALDVERYREIMTGLAKRSAAVVQHFGGSVEFTGDGVMAIFGAPIALEDHAYRGCLAALTIQQEANKLGAEVQERDGITLQLRVGLNSGQVIAGEIGAETLGYAATGEAVGMAQRMESVAPPGGVMLSASTAHLVEQDVTLGDPEWVHIKGSEQPVPARRLLAIIPRTRPGARAETGLVGRQWELAAIGAMADRAIDGRGGVVNVVGPPGIGKSRLAREAAALAADRGIEVIWAFCESHARDVPFYAATELLRAATGITFLDGQAAREQVRKEFPSGDEADLLLLDDLLGIADVEATALQIDPDARRRRLTALINTASLARTQPSLFIIEDAQWVDAVSESMLAEFLSVVPRTASMVLITARPEYQGALVRAPRTSTIALAPLADSDTMALLGELLGTDPSVAELATMIGPRAAGNPFFAEEMVRELAQRGVLTGERGGYVCRADVADVAVPATVQAAIEARIDRLSASAKQTLQAASVIGVRFDPELLTSLGIDPELDELLCAELIDQVRFTPTAEYAFRHPLIRAVAYESQLKSDRPQWHRRLAAVIQEREPAAVEENAALIAEHVEAAGDLLEAYGWHMRAGAWSTTRDLDAARLSWERACRVADKLVGDVLDGLPMRIAPRTMLCATDYQGPTLQESRDRFAELQQLCTVAGDKVSLAIGMVGLATELGYSGQAREGSRLASEQMALLESIDDPTPIMALAFVGFANWTDAGELGEMLRWSQKVIELADGDPIKGAAFGVGSPLAVAMTWRASARYWLGRPGWRQDLDEAVALARQINDPTMVTVILAWTYGWAIHYGVLRADDSAIRMIEESVQTAERTSNDVALVVATYGFGGALLMRDDAADRRHGVEMIVKCRDTALRKQVGQQMVPLIELWLARERARCGECDAAIALARNIDEELHAAGRLGAGVWATGVLAEILLERSTQDDLAEAQKTIDRLASLQAADGWAMRDITVLRLQTLLARARGDDAARRRSAADYRAMAESLGFEGHLAWADALS